MVVSPHFQGHLNSALWGKRTKATQPFPKQQILDFTKLKKFADDNFNLDANGRKVNQNT